MYLVLGAVSARSAATLYVHSTQQKDMIVPKQGFPLATRLSTAAKYRARTGLS